MSAKITELPVERKFPIEGELAGRMRELVSEYEGKISLVSAIGILELLKMELQQGQAR